MSELMNLIFSDIRFNFAHLGIGDFAKYALFGFWGMIWLFPLKGVDRRDYVAGLDFICFLCFAATILLFALPQSFDKQAMDWREFSTAMTIIIFLGAARWLFRLNAYEAVIVRTSTKKEESRG